jgi:hypothetical protein
MIKNQPFAQEIIRLYVEEKMMPKDIAKKFGYTKGGIWQFLKSSGIKMRTKSEAKSLYTPRGPQSSCWQGGVRKDGYKVRASTVNGKRKNILQHREVCETAMSRALLSQEVVHHCNSNPSDNCLHNLWVFQSQKDHARFHKDGTVPISVVFPVAERVLSFGFPWSMPWWPWFASKSSPR